MAFSDGTAAGYVAEELLELRPYREPTKLGLGHHLMASKISDRE